VVEGLELGANDYVTKPLDFPVVLARSALSWRSAGCVPGHRAGTEAWTLATTNWREGPLKLAEATPRVKFATWRRRSHPAVLSAWRLPNFLARDSPEPSDLTVSWRGDSVNAFRMDDQHLGVVRPRRPTATELRPPCFGDASHLLARMPNLPPVQVAAELSKKLPTEARVGQTFTLLYSRPGCGEFRFVSLGIPGRSTCRCMGRRREGRERVPIGVGMANNRSR